MTDEGAIRYFEVAQLYRVNRPVECANPECIVFISDAQVLLAEGQTKIAFNACGTEMCVKCREPGSEHIGNAEVVMQWPHSLVLAGLKAWLVKRSGVDALDG